MSIIRQCTAKARVEPLARQGGQRGERGARGLGSGGHEHLPPAASDLAPAVGTSKAGEALALLPGEAPCAQQNLLSLPGSLRPPLSGCSLAGNVNECPRCRCLGNWCSVGAPVQPVLVECARPALIRALPKHRCGSRWACGGPCVMGTGRGAGRGTNTTPCSPQPVWTPVSCLMEPAVPELLGLGLSCS